MAPSGPIAAPLGPPGISAIVSVEPSGCTRVRRSANISTRTTDPSGIATGPSGNRSPVATSVSSGASSTTVLIGSCCQTPPGSRATDRGRSNRPQTTADADGPTAPSLDDEFADHRRVDRAEVGIGPRLGGHERERLADAEIARVPRAVVGGGGVDESVDVRPRHLGAGSNADAGRREPFGDPDDGDADLVCIAGLAIARVVVAGVGGCGDGGVRGTP